MIERGQFYAFYNYYPTSEFWCVVVVEDVGGGVGEVVNVMTGSKGTCEMFARPWIGDGCVIYTKPNDPYTGGHE